MLDWIAAIGAFLLYLVIGGAVITGCGVAGIFVADFTRHKWAGWLAGLLIAGLLGLLFYPSLMALHDVSCRPFPDTERCQ